MKRKEEISDMQAMLFHDFSNLSVFSPPTKMSRLDVEFAPSLSTGATGDDLSMDQMEATVAPWEENEERALVLYRPMPPPVSVPPQLDAIPCNISSTLFHHLIPALRDQIMHNNTITKEQQLAVVPWAVNQFNSNQSRQPQVQLSSDSMEMEVETEPQQQEEAKEPVTVNGGFLTDSMHQWHNHNYNKHCMAPQFPTVPS